MKPTSRTIRQKINRAIFLTSTIAVLLAGLAYFVYELVTFRQYTVARISTVAEVISINCTAALTFQSSDEAFEILSALRVEEHVLVAALFDSDSNLFAHYPDKLDSSLIPKQLAEDGYRFQGAFLHGFQPVRLGENRIGTLYLKYDLNVFKEQIILFCFITLGSALLAFLVIYIFSARLQNGISKPVVRLAEVAKSISDNQDYSLRAVKQSDDEIGLLTDSFNQMLTRIEQQNQSLNENQERLHSILESMGDAFVSLDPEWHYTIVNDKAASLIGKQRQELIGRTIWDVFPDTRGSIFETEYFRVMNERVARRFETYYESYKMWLEVNAYPHEDGIAIFYTDITEPKKAELKLASQLARLALLSHITRSIGERMDLKSIFQVVIRSLEDQLPVDFGCIGLINEENNAFKLKSVGSKSLQLSEVFGDFEQIVINIQENKLEKNLSGKLIYEPELKETALPFFLQLGMIGMDSVVVAPLSLENHVFGCLICARKESNGFSSGDCEFLLQLSEHVALAANQAQLHEALHKAYNDLKQTQQTVLQQERLRALGQMASGIAHDINNAISPVSLYAESLLETEHNLSEKGRNYLKIIQQATDDVASTVGRMKEFYRKREPQLLLYEVDLNSLVNQVIELTRAKWFNMPRQKGIVIEIHADLTSKARVMGVESEIREALTNLVFNAVDAMPEGGTLTFRSRDLKTSIDPAIEMNYASLEVIDTGIGMDEETRAKCLEPFYTTKGERGTGLGLAMVYGVIQRHGADINLTSAPGKGTTIQIRFPAKKNGSGKEVTSGIVDRIPSRMRILVIDDDPLLLKSLQDTLAMDGHMITTAESGQSGLDAFSSALSTEPFQVVITDLGMPYVDGRKVAETIKKWSPYTPVIMLTGWGERIIEEGNVPDQVDYLLSKPPKLQKLREVLSQFENKM